MVQPLQKIVWWSLKKLNIEYMAQQLHYQVYIQKNENRDSNRYLHAMFTVALFQQQEVETTQVSIK